MTNQSVENWMTPNPITVTSHTPLPQALQLMERKEIHHLPVVDEDGLVGMVTWKDTCQALSIDLGSSGCFEVPWMNKLRVSDIMKRDFLTLLPYLGVGLAVEAMLKCRTDGLPVISHGKLVGIITEHDIDRIFTSRDNGENAKAAS